jgi:hypothetical protein
MHIDNDHIDRHIDRHIDTGHIDTGHIDRAEIRRELRSIDRAQRVTERSWDRALTRMFDPDGGVSDDERRRILGVPNRRQFLRIGGVTIAGAALLAACGDDGNGPASTGTTAAPGSTMAPSPGAGGMDLTLARTAASLEALAVATYDTAVTSGLVTTAVIGDAATLFRSHHKAHLDALNGLITQNGAKAVTEPNAAVRTAVVDPAVATARTEADIVALAFALEDAAAQTYVFAATQLSAPELRSTIMTIGGVEARHRALLAYLAQAKTPAEIFPAGFFEADNPLPADALLA